MDEPMDEEIGAEAASVERRQRWLGQTAEKTPEEIAAWVEGPTARWSVVTEEGEGPALQRRTAFLNTSEELPYWAYVLAKSYLDDVGEWPLSGFAAETALAEFEEHRDPVRAVHEILASVLPVWPDVRVVFVGEVGE